MNVSIGVGDPIVNYTLHFEQLWLTVGSPFAAKRSFFDERLEIHLSVVIRVNTQNAATNYIVLEAGSSRFTSSIHDSIRHK